MAARDASPSWEELVERPLSSITTGTGITMVQRRLSMTDASMGKEDSRMFILTTGILSGMMVRAVRAIGLFRGTRGQLQREGGKQDMIGSQVAAWTKPLRYLHQAYRNYD